MSETYDPKNLLDEWRIELRAMNESIEFWERPGARSGVITLGGEFKDDTEAHVRELRQHAARLESLIARVEGKQDVNQRAKSIVDQVTRDR